VYYSQNHFILTRCCFNCNYANARDHSGYSCSIRKTRPADWIEAMGHENLRHISRIRLSCLLHNCPHYFSLPLVQDSNGSGLEIDMSHHGILEREGSCWRAKTLRELLADRRSERKFGLSPCILKAVIAALCCERSDEECDCER
jgi:hypothetical protein